MSFGPARIGALHATELARFRQARPRSLAMIARANNLHLLLQPGWHQALRDLTRQYGTLLALDETHTHVVRPGGATRCGTWTRCLASTPPSRFPPHPLT